MQLTKKVGKTEQKLKEKMHSEVQDTKTLKFTHQRANIERHTYRVVEKKTK